MFRWIAIIAAVALAAGAAFGQSSSPPSAQPALPLGSGQAPGHHVTNGETMGPSMMDPSMMPMMRMMQMMHTMEAGMMASGMTGSSSTCHAQPGMAMAGAPSSHLAGRLAFVKAELAIDQAQEAGWQKYADAVQDRAQSIFSGMPGMHHAAMSGADFPAQFDARVQSMEAQLSGLKAIRNAAVGLYDGLNEEQKAKADTFLAMSLCI